MHPVQRLLAVVEVKTELRDIGDVERQLGSYVEASWTAAAGLGWRPRGATGILLLLATAETDRRLQEFRSYFDRAFPLRARALDDLIDGTARSLPERGARGMAMLDPASRRRRWLLPTSIDGRRASPRYADRAAFLASQR